MPPEIARISCLDDVRELSLPNVKDERGRLVFIQSGQPVIFDVRRVFFLAHVPPNAVRGDHAHRRTSQLLIPVAGSFCLELSDGSTRRQFTMNDCSRGILVPPMIWDRLSNFSAEAVCLVLASEPYDADEYIRDWDEFVSLRTALTTP